MPFPGQDLDYFKWFLYTRPCRGRKHPLEAQRRQRPQKTLAHETLFTGGRVWGRFAYIYGWPTLLAGTTRDM